MSVPTANRSQTRGHPSALAELIDENVLPFSKGQVIFGNA
jgi:hypothetical protein